MNGTEIRVMNAAKVVVNGTLTAHGTLVLEEAVNLPAGPVQVTVQPKPATVPSPERFWETMRAIWAMPSGLSRPRNREEIDADLNAFREEAEEQIQAIEALHEACRLTDKQMPPPEPAP